MNKRLGALLAGLLLMATALTAADAPAPCPFGPHNLPKITKNCKKLPPPPPPCNGPLPCPKTNPK